MSPDTPLSVAVLGTWHVHADDYVRRCADHPDTVLAGVWDPDAAAASAAAERWSVPTYASLEQALSSGVDGVIVTTATSDHDEVIRAALEAGVAVFTEKVLSPTVAGAEALAGVATARGVPLTVSLPQLFAAPYTTLARLIDEHRVGEVVYARVRMAHDGALQPRWLAPGFFNAAEALGGVFFDLGCHPVYLVQAMLGSRPERTMAAMGHVTEDQLDDNTTVVMSYANGAIGVAEASSVTLPGAMAIEVRGTEGAMLFGFGGERLIAKGRHFDAESWSEIPLDEPQQDPYARWVARIIGDDVEDPTVDRAVDVTRLLVDAGVGARA